MLISFAQPLDAWVPATSGTGQFHIAVTFKPRQVFPFPCPVFSFVHAFHWYNLFCNRNQESLTIQDFDLLKVIGKGSFGKVREHLFTALFRS